MEASGFATRRVRPFVLRVVDASARRPYRVLFAALVLLAVTWTLASRLSLHTELLELLPRDSPGFRAYEHTLGRTGGRATLLVIVESSDRAKNRRYIDDLYAKITAPPSWAPELIAYVESSEKEVRAFYEDNKWLYAPLADLEEADATLDHEIAFRSGLVANLDEPARSALGLDDYHARWDAEAKKHDDFPSGYFETQEGPGGTSMAGLRVISRLSGMGDRAGDTLLAHMKELAASLPASSYAPDMKVGFAGDIANAVEEKDSLLSDAVWATAVALLLISGGIALFFRSFASLVIIVLPALIGVGCAYAFAMLRFGYVNSTGAFLGAIILGNGINYPIVLLARYKEFRARGLSADDARRDAVWNAFRAELVGAAVGSIAYGSLVITRFRGFNQFGVIGFVGMLLVWVSMIPLVPALLVLTERFAGASRAPRATDLGLGGFAMRCVARLTEERPWFCLGLALLVTVVAAWQVPSFLRDPWEYNFARLGSRDTKVGGAGEWSSKAEKVFGGKMNIAGALMLADTPEQVPRLKQQILANDARDPEGGVVAEIATVDDLLPGPLDEQKAKLAVLDRIRERLTPRVLESLGDAERDRVREARPPDTLRVLTPKDLPPLLRRRFEENDGRFGTAFYVRYKNDLSLSDGHVLLRIAKTTDNVVLPDGAWSCLLRRTRAERSPSSRRSSSGFSGRWASRRSPTRSSTSSTSSSCPSRSVSAASTRSTCTTEPAS
jgi:uncharacterized protein